MVSAAYLVNDDNANDIVGDLPPASPGRHPVLSVPMN